MTECDDCGTDVAHVWRHRAFKTEGHRDISWVCPACHPELPTRLTVELESTDEATGATAEGASGGTTPELRSDGGLPGGTAAATAGTADATPTPTPTNSDPTRFACPICSGETVNGQGMYDCVNCGWTGPR